MSKIAPPGHCPSRHPVSSDWPTGLLRLLRLAQNIAIPELNASVSRRPPFVGKQANPTFQYGSVDVFLLAQVTPLFFFFPLGANDAASSKSLAKQSHDLLVRLLATEVVTLPRPCFSLQHSSRAGTGRALIISSAHPAKKSSFRLWFPLSVVCFHAWNFLLSNPSFRAVVLFWSAQVKM